MVVHRKCLIFFLIDNRCKTIYRPILFLQGARSRKEEWKITTLIGLVDSDPKEIYDQQIVIYSKYQSELFVPLWLAWERGRKIFVQRETLFCKRRSVQREKHFIFPLLDLRLKGKNLPRFMLRSTLIHVRDWGQTQWLERFKISVGRPIMVQLGNKAQLSYACYSVENSELSWQAAIST